MIQRKKKKVTSRGKEGGKNGKDKKGRKLKTKDMASPHPQNVFYETRSAGLLGMKALQVEGATEKVPL